MNFSFETDGAGHLVCRLSDGAGETVVGAADVAGAGGALLQAAEGAMAPLGYGECEWLVPNGEYRWMLRRSGHDVTVAVMWSSGTIMGYQHVFRGECPAAWFAERVQAELGRLVAAQP